MAYFGASSGSSAIDIGISLTLQDRFTDAARNISSQMRNLYGEAGKLAKNSMATMKEQAQQTWEVSSTIMRSVVNAIDSTMVYHDNMVLVKAITGATADEMVHLGNVTQTLAKETMFGAGQVADGMKVLAQAGFQLSELPTMISNAARLANATGIELGGELGGADIMTSVTRMFSIKEPERIAEAADMLAKASFVSNVNMNNLANSIKYVGSTMSQLNIPLEQTLALIGVLGNAGIKGSSAGVYLENLGRFLNQALYKPNSAGGKALKELGLTAEDLTENGTLKDLGEVVGIIHQKIQELGMDNLDTNRIFGDLFKVRGNRAAAAIANHLGDYKLMLTQIEEQSKGVVAATSEMRMKNLSGQWDTVKSNFENLIVTMTENLSEPLTRLLKVINGILGGLRSIADSAAGRFLIIGGLVKPIIKLISSGWFLLKTRVLTALGMVKDASITATTAMTNGWGNAIGAVGRYRGILRALSLQQQKEAAKQAIYNAKIKKEQIATALAAYQMTGVINPKYLKGLNAQQRAIMISEFKRLKNLQFQPSVGAPSTRWQYNKKSDKFIGVDRSGKRTELTAAEYSKMLAESNGKILGAGALGNNINNRMAEQNKISQYQNSLLVSINAQLGSIRRTQKLSLAASLKMGLNNTLSKFRIGGIFKPGVYTPFSKRGYLRNLAQMRRGAQVVAKTGAGIGAVLKGIGGKAIGKFLLGGIGRLIPALVGGPLGIVITALTFIPSIISAIKNRKKSSSEDADKVNNAADKVVGAADKVVNDYNKERYKPNPQLQQVIDLMTQMYKDGLFKLPPLNVNVTSKGKIGEPVVDAGWKMGVK